MTIDLFINFQKRKNSTKRPVEGGIVNKHTYTGYLKSPCNVINPVIELQNLQTQNAPCVYTYAWIPSFYRYYFVKDWTYENGVWTVSLEVDVLATYKTHIGETTAYIDRAAYEYNPYVIDTLYPVTREPDIHKTVLTSGWNHKIPSEGCYVVGIISGASSTVTGSAVTYYAMTINQLSNLVDYLLSDQFINDAGFTNSPLNTEPISHNVAKSLLNPLQYIVSCMWVPKTASSIGESSPRQIQVGYYSIATTIAKGYWMPDTVTSFFFTCDPPEHPDSATRGLYLNYEPYTSVKCFLPPFGQFPINLQSFRAGFKIGFHCYLDLVTGKANLRIVKYDPDNGSEWLIQETCAMMGVPIQLAQVANDFIKSATSFVSAAGSVVGAIGQGAIGNYIGAAHSGLMTFNSIGNAIESLFPDTITEGANGSFAAFRQDAMMITNYRYQVDENNTEQGKPLCEIKRIDTIPGFIKCGAVTVDYYAFSEELDMIQNYLLSGFFWE